MKNPDVKRSSRLAQLGEWILGNLLWDLLKESARRLLIAVPSIYLLVVGALRQLNPAEHIARLAGSAAILTLALIVSGIVFARVALAGALRPRYSTEALARAAEFARLGRQLRKQVPQNDAPAQRQWIVQATVWITDTARFVKTQGDIAREKFLDSANQPNMTHPFLPLDAQPVWQEFDRCLANLVAMLQTPDVFFRN